jgi:formamidopyrimidine-DNA glycosylase
LLTGQRFENVDRRGKYLLLELDSGDELMVHLGMTGHLLVCDADAPVAKHTHIRASLDDGNELRFDDARRFGRVAYGSREALTAARVLPRLGVEPLSDAFSQERLDAVLRKTTRTVKAALLDQKGVAGLGNIYIDEACFLAGVRPTRRCHRLTRRERAALLDAIPRVLTAAVANRGSSVDDYRDVWNARGSNQERLQVYGRGGLPCFVCGTTLRRTVTAGRTTVYCPHCQR